MDYQFTHNDHAQPIATFSMGGETLARWLSYEVGGDQQIISELLMIIEKLQHKEITEFYLQGIEYDLQLNQDEIEVLAHELSLSTPVELPEGTELYDQELISACGLEDLKQVLLSWQDFVKTSVTDKG